MQIKQMLCLSASAMALLMSSCASDTPDGFDGGKGKIVMHVGVNGDVTDAIPATRSSQATIVPKATELNLKLAKGDGSYAESWGSTEEFPTDKEFPSGAYTLEAFYGAPEFEGFDSPYYYGVTDLNIEDGQVTEATVTASLANCMVSIDYTDAFRSFFSQYSAQTHAEGGDYISFMSDETRPAYVRTGKTTVTVSVTKQNGLAASIEAAEFVADARHHYHITLDVNDGQTGQGEIVVQFDDSIVTEDVTIDVSDQALLTPAPVITSTGFSFGSPVTIVEGDPMEKALMTVNAAGGLSKVVLTTHSESLLSRGFPEEIDLMQATPTQQALLESFGLDVKGLYNKSDKMALIDFSKVTEYIEGAGSNTFTLVVKDKYSKVNEPVSLSVSAHDANLQITSLEAIRIDETQASMTVSCDAKTFVEKVGVQLKNNSLWSPMVIKSVTPLEGGKYKVTFNVPLDYRNFPLRLTMAGKTRAEGTLEKTGVILTPLSTGEIWATHATFKVAKNEAISLSDIAYYVNSGSAYAQAAATANADGTVTLTGLKPGTKMSIKASDTGNETDSYKVCQITTESALQLPNASMESWYSVKGGTNWSTWYAGENEDAVWGTNNLMTSSQGGDFAYCCPSATISSSDHTNGKKSALIRTVGWGSGNSAAGSISNIKYIDAGLLHLGPNITVREQVLDESGISFASRPSALTFDYKYTAKNSADFGQAVVKVYDTNGTLIAEGSKNLSAASSFSLVSIPLTYNVTNRKAAKIYVRFVSTVGNTFLNKNDLNLVSFLSSATHTGSQLYIDNIQLTY
ncbi:MAG: DUF4493 domain-containing protein [Muribaculaceae bacterium]|nr:DUF4493 domain-containing protein [Muribaculaceae bacterium]